MLETSLFSLFVAGLLGGGHCLGMCGGIVTALTVPHGTHKPNQLLLLGYNVGRIASYALIGALAGGISGFALSGGRLALLQWLLYIAANLILILLGLYLAGLSSLLTRVEVLGRPLWRRLQPLSRRMLPVTTLPQAIAVGAVWGWLPCGLVYSASLSALASASASNGAMLMLAFAFGTLPNLLLMGVFASQLKNWLQKKPVRLFAGFLVALTGLIPLLHLALT
ncbi:sulfite exporter TauE/SafE family protein [Craterilacuibacter sp.]|uniref:sulfite exporter TauE/SafE family protein n=1 Tax=Craterilacuibacter sp. TaxID=2870909 RepID=UPI003F37A789